MPVLLAIDDEPWVLNTFRKIFATTPNLTIETARSAAEGLEQIVRQRPDVILLDFQMPGTDGLQACREIQKIDARIPIIFITGQGSAEVAIEAMKLGAHEYQHLPKDRLTDREQVAQLRTLVDRAIHISRLMNVPVVAEEDSASDTADQMVGSCPPMQGIYKAIGRVAPQNVTVLILGESGTGKELIARAIYQHSRRASGPFLAINCAAIPETLLESELFGHEKGAFTGADRKRIGKFEQCNGGTLFLDEIGDMTPLTQTKILRVLQDQCFERVGGNETIQTNVRLIAATNRDLEKMVAEGTFRSDLYYRLSVFTIKLPPLRERGDDLPALIQHFVKRFKRELQKDVHQVDDAAMEMLRLHRWPGNLRELQSVLKQAMLQATGPVLLPDFFPAYLRAEPATAPASTEDLPDLKQFIRERLQSDCTTLYTDAVALLERYLLTEVLRHTGGNQVQAARLLGITRNSLRHKIRSLEITIERSIW